MPAIGRIGRIGSVILAAGLLGLGTVSAARAQAGGGSAHKQEAGKEGSEHKAKTVTIDQVPAKVRATIQREMKGGTLNRIEMEHDKGQPLYQAEIVKNGKMQEIYVDEAGKVVKRESGEQEHKEKQEGR